MEMSPFVVGRAVAPAEFFNRRGVLRRLLGRLGTGQSTALIGQPHIGKTSLLNYLLDDERRREMVGDGLDQCLFSYLDSQMLGSGFGQADFWAQVLAPLAAQFPTGEMRAHYELTRRNQFGAFTLEQLLTRLGQAGWRLVLLLDEFDALLNHPVLNSAEFYGSLRSLASRCSGLALVIATRRSLDLLNLQTQAINPHGSPYFNVFTELRLGPLPYKDTATLLKRAGERFGGQDGRFIIDVSGRHPFLLQTAAAVLWEISKEGTKGATRYRAAADELYRQTRAHFGDTWRAWSSAERKAITAIALAQIPTLVKGQTFLWWELVEDITDYAPELRGLKDSGTIAEAGEDNWRVTQGALLWWLTDEIKRATRDDTSFEEWLQAQELDKLLTGRERKRIGQAAKKVGEVVVKGATTLIESLAKGFGEGVGKATSGVT
jgi:hypothetical protein